MLLVIVGSPTSFAVIDIFAVSSRSGSRPGACSPFQHGRIETEPVLTEPNATSFSSSTFFVYLVEVVLAVLSYARKIKAGRQQC